MLRFASQSVFCCADALPEVAPPMAVAFVNLGDELSRADTSAGFHDQQDGSHASSDASLRECAAGKRTQTSSSTTAQRPSAKRQKLQGLPGQDQLDVHPQTSLAGAAQTAIGAAAGHSKARKVPGVGISAHGLHESPDDTSSMAASDDHSDDESAPGDPELGNLNVAESNEGTLSNAMLEALRHSVQHRLDQYPSQALDQDKAALNKAQTAAKR